MSELEEDINDDYSKIIIELKELLNQANNVLSILKPLTSDGEIYKDIFEDILSNIEKSYNEIKGSKTANTKYSNELIKIKSQIEEFLIETDIKQNELKRLISNIVKIEKDAESRFITIDRLKSESNESKKLITESKNEAEKLIIWIKKIKDESLIKIWELRDEKKESEKIQKILKIKEEEAKKLSDIINLKYNDLFIIKWVNHKTKINELDDNIQKAEQFNQDLNNKIQPSLDEKRKILDLLEEEMIQKNDEISSLLWDATAKSLDQWYLESMYEYSTGRKMDFKIFWFKIEKETKWYSVKNIIYILFRIVVNIFYNTFVFLNNLFICNLKVIFNYAIFILPLIIIVSSFLIPYFSNHISENMEKIITVTTVFDIILYKTLFSLPLIWISWFGQKNISQRKRLFEEYNHKSRVVKMYIMFTSKNQSYKLNNISELEKTLIKAIANNPAEHLGKWDTFIDKILEKFYVGGFYKKLKEEIIEDFIGNNKEKEIMNDKW